MMVKLAAATGLLLSLTAGMSGCSSAVQAPDSRTQTQCPTGASCLAGDTSAPVAALPSMPAAPAGAGGVTLPSTAPPGASPAAANPEHVPCAVAAVVSNNCALCHGSTPKFGAPMPLMTRSDFHRPSASDPTRTMYQVTPERLRAADATRRMPPASSAALSAGDLQVLENWLTTGATTTGAACAIQEPASPNAPGVIAEPQPVLSRGGSGGASPNPIEYDDPEMTCHRFLAHAPGDASQPFSVTTDPDRYTEFTFKAPWEGMMYARSFKTVPGNEAIIHHWLFYKNGSAGGEGEVNTGSGTHPDGSLMHGWAPGGDDLFLDPDVGQEMPGDVSYTLETHHNNMTGSEAPDASGIEVCVTPTPPKNIASVSWLGTDLINGTTAGATCSPTSGQQVNIVAAIPHMHLKGRHMKVVIRRANGAEEVLHDQPFDFQYQRLYLLPTQLMPGDSVTTSCTYSEPSMFGRGSNEEMCYLFTLYYPKLSLTNDGLFTALHGPDTCLN